MGGVPNSCQSVSLYGVFRCRGLQSQAPRFGLYSELPRASRHDLVSQKGDTCLPPSLKLWRDKSAFAWLWRDKSAPVARATAARVAARRPYLLLASQVACMASAKAVNKGHEIVRSPVEQPLSND